MRKFTYLFLSMMLSLVYSSAWAAVGTDGKLTDLTQLDNTQAFTLTAVRGTFASNADGTALAKAALKDAADTKQQFAFVKKNEESTTFYIYNISAGKFVGGDGTNVTLSSIGDEFQLEATPRTVDGVTYDWMIKRTTDNKYLMFNGGANPELSTWNQPDDGDVFIVGDAVDATAAIQNALALLNTVDVTYSVTFNGNVVATQEGKAAIGAAPELPDALKRDYCTYTYNVTTVTETTTAVTATATFDGPFQASASFDDAVWYFLKINGDNRYTHWDADAGQCPNENTKSVADNAQWAFVGNPYDGFKIYNKSTGNGYTLQDQEGNDPKVKVLADGTTANGNWFVQKNGETFYLYHSAGNYLNDHGGQQILTIWAVGSWMAAEAVPLAQLTDVTYNIIYNGVNVAAATVQQYTGQAPELPASLNLTGLCDYSELTGTITANASYNVTATWRADAPFQFSADYASADWKNITIRGTKYVNAVGEAPYTNVADASDVLRVTDEYQWAFLGNPYAVVIINKAGGADKSLKLEGANFVLSNGQNGQSIAKSADDAFAVIVRNADGGVQTTLNDNNGKLGTWDGEHIGDAGSQLRVAAVPEVNYAAAVAEEVTPWMESAGSLFGLKQDVYDANEAMYEAALESCNKATYDELKAVVNNAENLIYPETGYYRVQNKNNGYWLQWEEPADYSNNNTGVKFVQDGNLSASSVIRFEKKDDSFNQFAIRIQGKYLGAPDMTGGNANAWSGRTSTQNDDPYYYTFEVKTPGQVTFRGATEGDQNDYSYAQCADGQNNCFVTWAYEAKSEMVVVEAKSFDVALTAVNGKNYAMMIVPFDATLSNDDTKAYKITLDDAGQAKVIALDSWALSDGAVGAKGAFVEDTTIPAGTPVLLENENAETASLSIGEGYAATPSSDGPLAGSYVATGAPDGALALGVNGDGELGFFEAPAAASANSAYFTGDAQVLTLDDPVGIDIPASETIAIDAIYGADGIKQSRLLPGLNFIRQGNKVIKVIK